LTLPLTKPIPISRPKFIPNTFIVVVAFMDDAAPVDTDVVDGAAMSMPSPVPSGGAVEPAPFERSVGEPFPSLLA